MPHKSPGCELVNLNLRHVRPYWSPVAAIPKPRATAGDCLRQPIEHAPPFFGNKALLLLVMMKSPEGLHRGDLRHCCRLIVDCGLAQWRSEMAAAAAASAVCLFVCLFICCGCCCGRGRAQQRDAAVAAGSDI